MLKVPYAYAGCQRFTHQSLRLCRLPKIHMPILTLVKALQNAKNSLRLYRLLTIHMPILMLVKVPHNAENFLACAGSREFTRQFLRLCRLPTIYTPILTPVQAPNHLHTNPYTCEGSQKWFPTMLTNSYARAGSREFTRQSLRLCRRPTIHMPMLTPVQAPDNSHSNPYACECSQKFKQFNT
ncbi:hypothetical protein O181_132899 [Austropuccinia psidii MF-1]|uniref:Uncharacterized protein n=1 Tax=Austropuccinia psidii MF-1 TaxID=1389203 RepID=A0A9Q3L7X8_9BASI|nr:hypothetical protein [Austropuccinia psidii MF-1]